VQCGPYLNGPDDNYDLNTSRVLPALMRKAAAAIDGSLADQHLSPAM